MKVVRHMIMIDKSAYGEHVIGRLPTRGPWMNLWAELSRDDLKTRPDRMIEGGLMSRLSCILLAVAKYNCSYVASLPASSTKSTIGAMLDLEYQRSG